MSQKVGTLLPDIRAASRQRLLALDLPVLMIAGTVTIYQNTLTAMAEDFGAEGFAVGDYAKLAGLADGNNGLRRIAGVTPQVLTFDGAPFSTQTTTNVLVSIPPPAPAWQGETYTPTLGVPYVNEAFRSVGSDPAADGGYTRWTLLATWTLFYPSGKGTIGIESMAGRLLEQFRPSTPMVFGQSRGKVAAVDPGPLVQEPEWLIMPLTARITAWTDNRG